MRDSDCPAPLPDRFVRRSLPGTVPAPVVRVPP